MDDNPFEGMPDDEVEERLENLRDMGRHPGYLLLLSELEGEYEMALGVLVHSPDTINIYRTQGTMRVLEHLLGKDGDDLRQRLMAFHREELDERSARLLDPEG